MRAYGRRVVSRAVKSEPQFTLYFPNLEPGPNVNRNSLAAKQLFHRPKIYSGAFLSTCLSHTQTPHVIFLPLLQPSHYLGWPPRG